MSKLIRHNHSADGIDRRGFLECMAWAGTGVIWTVSGGILSSTTVSGKTIAPGGLHFVQISDSHIGFNKPANPDVNGTLQAAVDQINSLPVEPEFLIHTGDLTHMARANEFDTMDQILQGLKQKQIFTVPGEHDTASDDGKLYRERYGKNTKGDGWYSFDHKGIHFVGLVNVVKLEGLGKLGAAQLAWLADDLKARTSSTPIVLFAHIPLWTVSADWGWGTSDAEQALALLRRFSSVTVLNGHIHQVMQKIEGNVAFHTAMSTAFPQPKPGSAPAPGPMKVPDDRLRKLLGISEVHSVSTRSPLAVIDSPLVKE
ncbi:MAG TPA: metallophosphoesterase [Bryobacteraceae bacterium]|jgi:hypothetical protein